jgi:hypothetical protein
MQGRCTFVHFTDKKMEVWGGEEPGQWLHVREWVKSEMEPLSSHPLASPFSSDLQKEELTGQTRPAKNPWGLKGPRRPFSAAVSNADYKLELPGELK